MLRTTKRALKPVKALQSLEADEKRTFKKHLVRTFKPTETGSCLQYIEKHALDLLSVVQMSDDSVIVTTGELLPDIEPANYIEPARREQSFSYAERDKCRSGSKLFHSESLPPSVNPPARRKDRITGKVRATGRQERATRTINPELLALLA